jgi:predicted Zn-dependent protease
MIGQLAQQQGVSRTRLALWGWLLALGLSLASGFAVSGCAPSPGLKGEGPGGRAQKLALTPKQEADLGEKAYREILSKARVVHGGHEVARVKGVGAKIARAAEIEPLQREINLRVRGFRFAWEFNLVQDRQINAFCLPGGKVVVFTGLLPLAANDAQLATVMAHEIAHALAHHGSERLARQQAEGGDLIQALLGKAQDRQQETQADHIGLFLMTFAGYDPEQAVIFWERMRTATANSSCPPEILSDHPSDARRIAQMGTWIAPARAAKRAFDEGRIKPAPKR